MCASVIRVLTVATLSSLSWTGQLSLATSQEMLSSGPPADYYESALGLTGKRLRYAVHDVVDDHGGSRTQATVKETAKSFEEDRSNTDNVITTWRNDSVPKETPHGGVWELTYSWPASYGFPRKGQQPSLTAQTDLHALFAASYGYAIRLDNLPFDHCPRPCIELPVNGHSQTSNWYVGEGASGSFQVWPGRGGDMARALFYMDVRYEGGADLRGKPEPDLILTDDRSLIAEFEGRTDIGYMGILSTLLEWHLEDPVDDYERRRNDIIFEAQDNRNPFIDHPEWVCSIWDHPDCPPPTPTPDPSPTASVTHTPSPTPSPTATATASPTPPDIHRLYLPWAVRS